MFILNKFSLIILTRCNLRCRLCCEYVPQSRPFPDMTVEEARRILEAVFQVAEHINTLHLTGGGEPFLHPQLATLVETAMEYQQQFDVLMLFTNSTVPIPPRTAGDPSEAPGEDLGTTVSVWTVSRSRKRRSTDAQRPRDSLQGGEILRRGPIFWGLDRFWTMGELWPDTTRIGTCIPKLFGDKCSPWKLADKRRPGPLVQPLTAGNRAGTLAGYPGGLCGYFRSRSDSGGEAGEIHKNRQRTVHLRLRPL